MCDRKCTAFTVSHAEHQSDSGIHQSIFIMPSYLLHQKKLPWQATQPFLRSMIWPTRLLLGSLVNITGLISQSQSSIFASPASVQLWRLVTKPCGFKFNPEHQKLDVRPELCTAEHLCVFNLGGRQHMKTYTKLQSYLVCHFHFGFLIGKLQVFFYWFLFCLFCLGF